VKELRNLTVLDYGDSIVLAWRSLPVTETSRMADSR